MRIAACSTTQYISTYATLVDDVTSTAKSIFSFGPLTIARRYGKAAPPPLPAPAAKKYFVTQVAARVFRQRNVNAGLVRYQHRFEFDVFAYGRKRGQVPIAFALVVTSYGSLAFIRVSYGKVERGLHRCLRGARHESFKHPTLRCTLSSLSSLTCKMCRWRAGEMRSKPSAINGQWGDVIALKFVRLVCWQCSKTSKTRPKPDGRYFGG